MRLKSKQIMTNVRFQDLREHTGRLILPWAAVTWGQGACHVPGGAELGGKQSVCRRDRGKIQCQH